MKTLIFNLNLLKYVDVEIIGQNRKKQFRKNINSLTKREVFELVIHNKMCKTSWIEMDIYLKTK